MRNNNYYKTTILCLFIFLFSAPSLAKKDLDLLPIPYQIEGTTQLQDNTSYEKDYPHLNTYVIIDLGKTKNPNKAPKKMTLIGTKSSVTATLYTIKKNCSYLCGYNKEQEKNEGEECHHVGLYQITKSLKTLGDPLVAIPGKHRIKGLDNLQKKFLKRRFSPPKETPEVYWKPIWPPTPDDQTKRYALTPTELLTMYPNRRRTRIPLNKCEYQLHHRLGALTCKNIALFTDGRKALAVSYPDYNAATARMLSAFEIDKLTYYIIQLGLKAQSPVGLMVHTNDGWKLLIRPKDYALLC